MFVKHHENLELLSISIDEQLEAATPGWADDLSTLCAEMGVVFASDDSGAPEELVLYGTDEHPGFEYVEDEDSDPKFAGWLDEEGDWCECRICTLRGPDDASDATEEVSKDPKLDFDAEDDEMWAHLWSEKKRLAMGLAPNLEDRGDINMEEPNADSASSASSSSSSNIKVDVDSIADALWVFEVDSSNPSSAPTG
ncbi:hypothetical protein BCR35DRAFT_324680 [Leucosporidium creatinivorum]|uniref:Uncharacterized protein n=1 Tax=Leucosporidium creatinivorum TaxID=106004 RepID=A0A1Y2FPS3_9BASI|nr:hypothetical protein BCR35DRAFT_324680 [Leucosporidium creatinivorum]